MTINLIDTIVKRKISDALLLKAEEIYYEKEKRNEIMSSLGWSRHLLHEFQEQLYLGDIYEQEKNRYGLELLKKSLSLWTYSSPTIDEYNELFLSRALPRIKRYDSIEQQPEVAESLALIMREKEAKTYSSEVNQFYQGLSTIVFTDQKQLENFIAQEITSALPDFKYDSKFSSKNLLAFSKPFFESWKIVIFFDREKIRSYFRPSWDGSEKNHRFGIELSLCHEKNRTGRNQEQHLSLSRNMLFSRYDLNWFYKTSCELKTHLLFELTCFKYELAFFEKPIFDIFSELEREGFSN